MRHLLRRLGFYLIALWASLTLNFLIPRLAPGNPALIFVARFQGRIRPEAIHAIELQFGITNDPLWVQYFQYLNNLLHGNLGLSITYFPTPVAEAIGQELPWTLVLVLVSLVLSFALGTLLGVIIAWRRNSFLDSLLPPLMTFISAIPYFCLALILLYIFGFTLNWFPVSGGYDRFISPDWSPDFISSAIQHAILPAITFVVASISGWMLGMRNAMIMTLSEDYVLMAQAKGLATRRVMINYAARNAILPNITGFAIALGQVVAGQLFLEIVFSYPGIGYSLFQAVQNSDYALMQGIFLIITVAVMTANFLVDMVYTVLDPRVRQERG
ncbi:ABC transporter permease [Ktedonobacter racemifer]|uniref:Binding-protein-dependent transport systems inner membrane component n=1 Tax=Ktedonobacter racemifer DSM 44963 TaxID=485913 RepID=D6U0N8_KTERA|nr:ABC transporter permease [Ktedonobacter racemifer]EFH82378.1 binding-protein-dependent transport systems inner membrane component [Ktedonobacter racemifer DSM 44963]